MRTAVIFLLSMLCLPVARGVDIPSVAVIGTSSGDGFEAKVEMLLREKMVYCDITDTMRIRFFPASDLIEAEKSFGKLRRDEYRVLLLCVEGETDTVTLARIAKKSEKIGMEVLWYGDPQSAIGRAAMRLGIFTADYAGFCHGQKQDVDTRRADYIAEACAQWWTGIARSNRGIERVKLWDTLPPHYQNKSPEFINALARIDGVSEPELEIFLPFSEVPSTAILFLPGGGYSFTGFLRNGRELALIMADQGVAVFGLKYRTKRMADIALADAQRAMRLIRSRAVQWGVNPEKLGVAGQSAGAHLVLNLAAHFDRGNPTSPDPVEKMSCRPDFAVPITSWNMGSKDLPFTYGTSSPPFFVLQASNDSGFRIAELLVEQLRVAGVQFDYRFVDTGGHGAFEIIPGNPNNDWPKELAGWLRSVDMLDK